MGTRFQVEAGEVDLLQGVIRTSEGVVAFTPNELAILGALHDASPAACSAEALLTKALGYAASAKSRTVTVTLQRLRKKVELRPSEPRTLVTVRGEGYALRYAEEAPSVVPGVPAVAVDAQLPRGRTLDEVDQAFASGGAPVVLIGPGGIGKTTLARAWSRRERAVWVELFGVRTPQELRLRLVEALEPDSHQDPDAGLLQRLRQGAPVVLDNAEDLDDEARGLLCSWLDQSAVPILVTSQRPLGATDERRVVIGELVQDVAAQVLQEQRARVGLPPLGAEAVTALLAEVGGLPLALVVAAPLADLVEDGATLLTAPSDATAAHHSSVQVGVGRSLRRLAAPSRTVAVAIAVAAPGCDLKLVGAAAGLPLPQVIGAVAELRARGFASVDAGRIDLLPVIRTLCRTSEEHEPARTSCQERLVRWLVEQPAGHHVLKPLRDQIGNALPLAKGVDRIELLRRHLELLYSFGPVDQVAPSARRWLAGLPPSLKPRADVVQAMAVLLSGDRDAGRELLLAVLPNVQDPDSLALGAGLLATTLAWRADPAALTWAERALAVVDRVERPEHRVAALHYAGYAQAKSGVPGGLERIEEAIRLGEAELPVRALSAALSKARLQPSAPDLSRCQSLLERATPMLGRVQRLIEQADLAVILLGAHQLEAAWALLVEPREVLATAHPRLLDAMLLNAVPRMVDRPQRARMLLDEVTGPGFQTLIAGFRGLLDRDRAALERLERPELSRLLLAFLDGEPLPTAEVFVEARRGLQAVRDRTQPL